MQNINHCGYIGILSIVGGYEWFLPCLSLAWLASRCSHILCGFEVIYTFSITDKVNEMKDSATQIEEELDKTKTSLHKHKMDLARMKDQLSRMDNKDPNYVSMDSSGYIFV
jgi:hypothetical protein